MGAVRFGKLSTAKRLDSSEVGQRMRAVDKIGMTKMIVVCVVPRIVLLWLLLKILRYYY